MEPANTKVESFTYDSKKPGRTLVVIGSVHGNEKCGTVALQRLKAKLDAGEVKVTAGKLKIIPIANPGAHAANKRFLERNLNRSLYPKKKEECKFYEDFLDNQICAVLEGADYLLDIHSYTVGGPPFIFIGPRDAEEKAFAEALGVTRNFIWGWKNAYKSSGISEKEAMGTTEYAQTIGVRGLTLECGQHVDPKNPDIAYYATLRAMQHVGLIEPAAAEKELKGVSIPPLGKRQFAKMITVVRNDPATLARDFQHFEPIKAGEVLARYGDGKEVVASANGYAILPNNKATAGAEIIYLAVDEEPFKAL